MFRQGQGAGGAHGRISEFNDDALVSHHRSSGQPLDGGILVDILFSVDLVMQIFASIIGLPSNTEGSDGWVMLVTKVKSGGGPEVISTQHAGSNCLVSLQRPGLGLGAA